MCEEEMKLKDVRNELAIDFQLKFVLNNSCERFHVLGKKILEIFARSCKKVGLKNFLFECELK